MRVRVVSAMCLVSCDILTWLQQDVNVRLMKSYATEGLKCVEGPYDIAMEKLQKSTTSMPCPNYERLMPNGNFVGYGKPNLWSTTAHEPSQSWIYFSSGCAEPRQGQKARCLEILVPWVDMWYRYLSRNSLASPSQIEADHNGTILPSFYCLCDFWPKNMWVTRFDSFWHGSQVWLTRI